MNKRAFRAKMIYYGDTYESVAEALNISPASVGNKVNGRFPFTQDEITILKERWNLTPQEVDEIFL